MSNSGPEAGRDHRADTVRGIALMCLAVLLFILLEMSAKAATHYVPVAEVVWARYTVHLLFMIIVVGPKYRLKLVRTRHLKIQMLRSVLLGLVTACTFFGLSRLAMPEVTTISFAAPFLVAALSVPLLKEHVGVHRWAAIIVGFIGVLIVLRPGLGIVDWAAFVIFGAAFFNALYQIATRKIAGKEDPIVSIFYTSLVGAIALSIGLPFFWTTPDSLWGVLAMIGAGIFGGTGHFLLIVAYKYAPASLLSPFYYTQIVWSVVVGYLAFGDLPDQWTVVGAAVVVGSGLYLMWREIRRKRAFPTAPNKGSASAQ